VQARRSDGFAPVRELLPPGLKSLGFVTFDDPEASLWRPFGTIRIEHVTPEDTSAKLRERGLHYVLVNASKFGQLFQQPFEQWLTEIRGQVASKISLPLRGTGGDYDFCLVRLD